MVVRPLIFGHVVCYDRSRIIWESIGTDNNSTIPFEVLEGFGKTDNLTDVRSMPTTPGQRLGRRGWCMCGFVLRRLLKIS